MNSDDAYLLPHVFTRHKLHLHTLLLENQPWFSARDLGRLLRLFLDDRAVQKLDPDQRQSVRMLIHGVIEDTLLIANLASTRYWSTTTAPNTGACANG